MVCGCSCPRQCPAFDFSQTPCLPKHTGSPLTTDVILQGTTETWEGHTKWQGLWWGRYQSFLSGPLLLPPRCWICQDVVKLIRGFQASWKEDKNRGEVEINLYCFHGSCTFNLIPRAKEMAKPLASTEAACSMFLIPPSHWIWFPEVRGVRVSTQTSESKGTPWDWQDTKGMWPGHLGALLRKASRPWKAGI